MILLALLAVALCGLAVAALARAFALPRTRVATRLDELTAYGFAGPAGASHQPHASKGLIGPLAETIGAFLVARVRAGTEEELRGHLLAAGMYNMSPRALVGYRALAAIALGLLGTLLAATAPMKVLLALLFGLCGWILTLTYVRRRGAARATSIDRELPNVIDQVVVTLEAGVGFSSSLKLAADRLSGPLGEELRLTLQEQRMGLALTESLTRLRDRVDAPNVRSFARAVMQAERLGVSMGAMMRDLAADMRLRRRQSAEEQARKAPVKILLPLVFMILPAMFVVLLGPAMIQISNELNF